MRALSRCNRVGDSTGDVAGSLRWPRLARRLTSADEQPRCLAAPSRDATACAGQPSSPGASSAMTPCRRTHAVVDCRPSSHRLADGTCRRHASRHRNATAARQFEPTSAVDELPPAIACRQRKAWQQRSRYRQPCRSTRCINLRPRSIASARRFNRSCQVLTSVWMRAFLLPSLRPVREREQRVRRCATGLSVHRHASCRQLRPAAATPACDVGTSADAKARDAGIEKRTQHVIASTKRAAGRNAPDPHFC